MLTAAVLYSWGPPAPDVRKLELGFRVQGQAPLDQAQSYVLSVVAPAASRLNLRRYRTIQAISCRPQTKQPGTAPLWRQTAREIPREKNPSQQPFSAATFPLPTGMRALQVPDVSMIQGRFWWLINHGWAVLVSQDSKP